MNEQYNVTGKASAAAKSISESAVSLNREYHVTDTVSAAAHDASQWAAEHHVAERLGGAASAAVETLGMAAKDASAWAEEHRVGEKASALLGEVGGAAARLQARWTTKK